MLVYDVYKCKNALQDRPSLKPREKAGLLGLIAPTQLEGSNGAGFCIPLSESYGRWSSPPQRMTGSSFKGPSTSVIVPGVCVLSLVFMVLSLFPLGFHALGGERCME